MAKIKKYKKAAPEKNKLQAEEASAPYYTSMRLPVLSEYPYKKFEKLMAKVPFTQKEWAGILNLSERTLQRYAKDNTPFEGIYVDRISHVQQVIEKGIELFTDADALYRWLKRKKQVLDTELGFEALFSTQGIQDILDELGRLQHGVYL